MKIVAKSKPYRSERAPREQNDIDRVFRRHLEASRPRTGSDLAVGTDLHVNVSPRLDWGILGFEQILDALSLTVRQRLPVKTKFDDGLKDGSPVGGLS
jgi:hypothetical protein